MPFLDGLNRIDWSSLHHAYGPATDVPELLRALVDPSAASAALKKRAATEKKSVRDVVQWELWGNVFHQGSRWQVTATVVPFLVQILREGPRDVELQNFLIVYLHHLAIGYPDDEFPRRVDPDEWFASVVGLEDPGGEPDYGGENPYALVWERDTYVAVEAHVDAFVELLDSTEDAIADAAIALVSSFPRRREVLWPALIAIAQRATEPRAGLAAVGAALLVGADAQPLAERLVASSDRRVAIHAACASVIADCDRASPLAVSRLLEPIGALKTERSCFASTIGEMVGRCIPTIGSEHAERAVEALQRLHASATPMELVSLSHSLLALVFRGTKAPAASKDLTKLQRRGVEVIRDHGAFSVGATMFVNYSFVMQSWGLPDTREELTRWLGRS